MPDDTSPAGAYRERFASTDLGEVEEFLSTTYAEITLRHTGDPQRFGYRHDTVGAGAFTISRMRTSLGYGARLDGMHGTFVVATVRTGGFSSTSGHHDELGVGSGDTALTPPAGDVAWISDPIDVDLVALDGAAVAAYAEHASGVDDLRVTGLTPISDALARYWNATVAHVRDHVLGNPEMAASPIIVDSAFRTLAAALLAAFPYTAVGPPPRGDVPPRRLDDVVEHLTTHAHQPVGPADVARIAGAPVREVVEGLRRRRGTHPAELLWNARLLGARRELRDADPAGGTTVATVAARWGFTHLGRFRIAYARAFDEQPDDTLRR